MQPKQTQEIRVTPKQNAYLLQLKDGPKTTNDLMKELSASMATANKMLKTIRDAELIESHPTKGVRGNVHIHTLTIPYNEMIVAGLTVSTNNGSIPVPDGEILYAAILRNAGLVGQRLQEQYLKIYSNRAANKIKNIVLTARRRGLCR